MFFSVLTKNLNWESLTQNLVTFILILLWGFTEKSDFLWGRGGTQTKSGWWCGGGGWTAFRFKGEGNLVKKDGVFSLPHFGRQGACHDITKSADSQANINFSENDCIITEILQKRLSNE